MKKSRFLLFVTVLLLAAIALSTAPAPATAALVPSASAPKASSGEPSVEVHLSLRNVLMNWWALFGQLWWRVQMASEIAGLSGTRASLDFLARWQRIASSVETLIMWQDEVTPTVMRTVIQRDLVNDGLAYARAVKVALALQEIAIRQQYNH